MSGEPCPICGETSPEPSEICIPRLVKSAKQGEPCPYSREGYQRFADEVGNEKAALINAIGAAGSGGKPPKSVEPHTCRVQALGAAISRREWSEVEAAYAAIRDARP